MKVLSSKFFARLIKLFLKNSIFVKLCRSRKSIKCIYLTNYEKWLTLNVIRAILNYDNALILLLIFTSTLSWSSLTILSFLNYKYIFNSYFFTASSCCNSVTELSSKALIISRVFSFWLFFLCFFWLR